VSPRRVVIGYIVGCVLAVTLAAMPLMPLGYAYFSKFSRHEVWVSRNVAALTDLSKREGPAAVAAAVRSQSSGMPAERLMVFADPDKKILAGTLRDWPRNLPDQPVQERPTRVDVTNANGEPAALLFVISSVILPDGYRLLVGRKVVMIGEFAEPLWYGMAGTVGVVLVVGAFVAVLLARRRNAVRLSEERYERHVLASAAGLWEWDVAKDEYYVSPAMLELCGFPPGTTFAGREDFMRRAPFYPEDLEKYQQAVRQLFAEGGSRLSMEVRQVRGDATRWFNLVGMCFRDAAGKPVRWTGSATEITDRKRIELDLRKSEQRYALAMEAAADGHMDWDFATGELYVSPRMKQILGHSADATFADLDDWVRRFPFHPEDRKRWEAAIAAHFAGTEAIFRMDLRIIVNGETRWLAFNFIAERDAAGKVVRWTGSIADINDAKRDVATVVESIPGLVAILTPTGELEAVNDPLAAYCGQPVEVLKNWGTNGTVHPEDVPKSAEIFMQGISTGEPYEFEARIRRSDAAYRWNLVSGHPFRDSGGKIVRWYSVLVDIDDRKRAEEAQRMSEERYALALEASDEGHFDLNLKTGEMFVSARMNEIYGFARHAETADRAEYFERIPFHPGDRPLLADTVSQFEHRTRGHTGVVAREVLAGGAQHSEFEYRILRGQARELCWIHARWMIVNDANGAAQRVIGVVSDITERKRIEEELQISEERYALALEASEEGHFDINLGTGEIFVSARVNEIYGHPPQARTLSRDEGPHLVPFHPDDRARMMAEVGKPDWNERNMREVEFRIVPRPGETRWVRSRAKVMRDAQGHARRRVGVLADITERKRAEDALRESQQRYERAMLASKAGYWDYDLATDGYYLSPAMLELAGFTPDAIFSGRDDFIRRAPFHPPEERDNYLQAVRELFAGDGIRLTREVRLLVDGDVRWINMEGLCLRDAAGKVSRWTGFATDVTLRKHAEEDLRKMEDQLRSAQRLEALGTLAGGIAHDFNNILGAILGYGEMAVGHAKKGSRLQRDLDSIMAAGERGRALVDRVLAFSRSGIADRVPVHVEAIVREALDQVAARLPEEVAIARSLKAGHAAILGDATQVHQVVMNLATNAVQAMPKGGTLRVTLETVRFGAPQPVTVGSIVAGEYIVLKVNDSGTGIPESVLQRMFDPFFTTKEVGVGSGLGLSLVHGIVTSMDGAINVQTRVGKGSTFTVYLKRSGSARAEPASENRPMPRGAGQRVLVIDDEEPLVRLATATLEGLGYSPVGFTSSVKALQEFGANPGHFDAILTDERMPGVTGSKMIEEVRRINGSIPILLMSGFVSAATALKARELGANDVLKKPLLARELAASLARALQL
jgi:PAS domain S-box-containing protein